MTQTVVSENGATSTLLLRDSERRVGEEYESFSARQRGQVISVWEKRTYIITLGTIWLWIIIAAKQLPWLTLWGEPCSWWIISIVGIVQIALTFTYYWVGVPVDLSSMVCQIIGVLLFVPLSGITQLYCLAVLPLLIVRAFARLPRMLAWGYVSLVWFLAIMIILVAERRTALADYLPSIWALCIVVTGSIWLGLLYRFRLIREVEAQAELCRMQKVTSELVQAGALLQDHMDQVNAKTVKEEQLRLSRELHDTVAYTLTSIAARIETGTELIAIDPVAAVQILQETREQVREGLREVRNVVRTLRGKAETGFRGPQRWEVLADSIQYATRVQIRLSVQMHLPPLVDALEELVYRLLQEGIVNAYRHGRATVVQVHIWIELGHLCVSISDNGCGTRTVIGGFGLIGMQERVHAMGGRISWQSEPGMGFELAVEIPVEGKEPL